MVEDEDREEEKKTENQATSQADRDTQLPVIESGVMGDCAVFLRPKDLVTSSGDQAK